MTLHRGDVAVWSFDERGTTKDTKDGIENVHPQISQISTDEFNPDVDLICENLRNLWINPLVNKYHVAKELCFVADRILRGTHRKNC